MYVAHYLWEFKSSNLAQIRKKMQTKKSHMNQLNFHSNRKTCANFEFTSFSFVGVQTVKIIKSDSSVYCMLGCSSGPERHWQRNWRVVSTSSCMWGCKRWKNFGSVLWRLKAQFSLPRPRTMVSWIRPWLMCLEVPKVLNATVYTWPAADG